MAIHVRDMLESNYPEYSGWFDYPADRTIAFNKVDDEWGILGNFARTPLTVDGVTFYSAESLFQVMKLTDPQARRHVFSMKGLWLKKVANKYAATVGRADWPEIFVDALKFCIMTKYAQNVEFRAELARTGDRIIVESAHGRADTYSAKLSADGTTWTGGNLMGRLLMELRDKGTLDFRLPPDAVIFPDLRGK